MKILKRGTSILLALIMLTSVVTSVMAVTTGKAQTSADTSAAGLSADAKAQTAADDDTDLTINFDYDPNTTVDKAKTQVFHKTDDYPNSDYLKYYENDYNWKHVSRPSGYSALISSYNVKDKNNPLRTSLESTDTVHDKYIVLDGDFEYYNLTSHPEPIAITSDKVLDLNGHTIKLRDDSNKKNESSAMTDHKMFWNSKMFTIDNGATLTIIDSSETRNGKGKGTGKISADGRIIQPFDNKIKGYVTRDIFWVNDGNLVIYGGTYKAGRSKAQKDDSFKWSDFQKIVGSAVSLGVSVMEYASGISSAKAGLADVVDSFTDKIKNDKDDKDDTEVDSQKQKKGEDGVEEVKKDKPTDKDEKRNQAIDEKNDDNNKKTEKENKDNNSSKPTEPSNDANKDGSAKQENEKGKDVDSKKDKNVKIQEAEKKVAEAALDKDKITGMVDSGFEFVDSIISAFHSNAPSVTESFLGTVAHVGNNSTFVSYGGNFIGYGSTANTRNAVIEVVEQPDSINERTKNIEGYDEKFNGGLAYIYGGDFEGRTGANIFNIVKMNGVTQSMYQCVRDEDGGAVTAEKVALDESETCGQQIVSVYNGKPVNTRNIVVRGGNFNCNAQLTMVGIETDGKKTTFPGTPGFVNLGIESYSADYIKDGRIQLVDTYGEGALVLMDEQKDENEKIHHYRLFCSEAELRYKQHLKVYPNEAETNTTHSFSLQSTYQESGSKDLQTLTNTWADDALGSERNSPYNSTEKYFEYPINASGNKGQSTSKTYYIMPSTINNDVYGKNFSAANIWYYSTPRTPEGGLLTPFTYRDINSQFSKNDKVTYASFHDTATYLDDVSKANGVVISKSTSYDYLSNLKWFHYKIYRVDPLTRENISESDVYGEDKPLADVVYGVSNDSLKCKLPLAQLEKHIQKTNENFKYQPGDMYRVELYIDEYLSYNYTGSKFAADLNEAKLKSSILFTCYDEWSETKYENGASTKTPDYTPLQWKTAPKAGEKAEINIVNGKAGQVDLEGRKIFDVYYQWYAVDDNGAETMIAGTPDSYIYKGNDTGEKKNYTIANIPNSQIKNFKNTVDPSDPNKDAYDTNGLPKLKSQWNADMLHAYSLGIMGDTCNTRLAYPEPSDTTKQPSLSTNYKKRFETGTDSCYIPEEYLGKDIKVKAIVVNVFWPLNFDHIQVYESHLSTVTSKNIYAEMKADYTGDYINKNGATLRVSKLAGLDKDEYVTRVSYGLQPDYSNGDMIDVNDVNFSKSYTNLMIDDVELLPTAKFPDDFITGKSLTRLLNSNNIFDIKLDVTVRTSEGRYYTTPYETYRFGQPGATGDCEWELDANGKLSITGMGAMENYSKVSSTPWYSKLDEIKQVVIFKGVKNVSPNAFTGAANLTTVTIKGGDITIGDYAFDNCESLTNISLGSGITQIGDYAFRGTALTSVSIPSTVKSIGKGAFSNNSDMKSLTINGGDIKIGENAFIDNTKLKKVYIPDSVTSIGDYALGYTSSRVSGRTVKKLIDDFYMFAPANQDVAAAYVEENEISNSGTLRGGVAWEFDIKTNTVTVSPKDGETATGNYGSLDIYGTYHYETDDIPWYLGLTTTRKVVENLIIEDGITEIGDGVFYNVGAKNLTLPTSVKKIGQGAFAFAVNLTNVDLGRIEEIGDTAFFFAGLAADGGKGITELTIPKSCKSIGSGLSVAFINKLIVRKPNARIYDDGLALAASEYYGYEGSTLQQWTEKYEKEFKLIDPIPEIAVSDAIARKGSTISVNVNMYDNPGIAAMKLTVDYPEQLELMSVDYNDNLFSSSPTGKNGTITWFSAKSENEKGDGTIATLTFKVKNDAELGKYPISVSYDKDDVIDSDDNPVAFTTTKGFVNVKNLKPGDTNNDDKVNMKDINTLQKKLNGLDVDINDIAADVNGDGKVNMKDLILLLQYINGWEVVLQ